MKARFLALAALVLGLASCQQEFNDVAQLGGEVDYQLKVDAAELATRADADVDGDGNSAANSAYGAIDYLQGVARDNASRYDWNDVDLRYSLEVYDAGADYSNTTDVKPVKDRMVKIVDQYEPVVFDLRLVPGRNYHFVVFADFVPQGATVESTEGVAFTEYQSTLGIHHTIGSDLRSIQIKDDAINDERCDAYFATTEVTVQHQALTTGDIVLKRPYGKLRVIATDLAELNLNVDPAWVEVTYTAQHPQHFNAVTGNVTGFVDGDYGFSSTYNELYKDVNKGGLANHFYNAGYDSGSDAYSTVNADGVKRHTHMTLFTDYILGSNTLGEQTPVQFTMTVYDKSNNPIKTTQFNTTIPIERNHLTTIVGNVLTSATEITVTIDDNFANANNTTDAPYYQQAVTNGVELIKALLAGQEIIVLNNITVTAADYAEATTRANAPIYPVINLNGFTITIENNNTEALVNLNGGALTVEGDGAIESNAGALVKGDTYVTGVATVDEKVAVDETGDSAVKSGIEALKYVIANGGEFTLTKDIESDEVLLVSATEPVVINGANCTLTSTATRAIRITPSKANVTINDLNIVVATERVYPNDVRGISLDAGLNGVDLTLNNCSVDFTHKTANDWAYAVNVSGNGTDNKVTVNGGTYNGANVVNANSAKNTIVVKNATLTSLYPNNDTYYGACIWVLQNQGSTVYAEGNTFNGNNAVAFNLGTGTTLEEKDNIDNTMYYDNGTCYVGSSEKFQKAIAEGANNIVLGKGTFDLPSSLTQNEGTLTIIGAGVEETILNGAKNSNANNPGNYANGVALEFDGLTFKTANNGYNGGFGHAVSVTFRESKIVGQFYAHSGAPHYFYDCIIDPLTGYLYTYSSNCVFERCTFSASEGKALQIYADASTGEHTVTITDCEFVAAKQAQTWDGKPVTGIDINSVGAKFTVAINGCTATGFPAGLNSKSTLWNVKDAGKAHANVYVDGVQVWFAGYDQLANYPNIFTKDGNYYVFSVAGLQDLNNYFKANSMANSLWDHEYNIAADIDATGFTWDGVYVVVGYNGKNGIVLNGNNHTISNLTINNCLLCGTPCGSNEGVNPGLVKDITMENVVVNGSSHDASVFWGNCYTNVNFENVTVDGATIKGGCNVGALVSRTSIDGPSTSIKVNFKNCVVKNSTLEANSTKADRDPTGASGFIGRTYGNTKLTFENCSIENNTINNAEGLVGGAVYGYTTWYGDGFKGTGACDTFTNWKGLVIKEVSTVEELNSLNQTNAYVVLCADIDFQGAAMTKPIELWEDSTFDGMGHKISNVKTPVQGGYATSLFRGDANTGNKVVKNLVIDNLTTPAGYSYAAAICSDLQGANIEIDNVHINNSTIEANGTIGGFVGFVSASTTSVVVKNSSINNSNLKGGEADHKRGAVVGRAYGCTVTCKDVVVDNVKINDVAATTATLVGDKGYTGTVTVR